MKLKIPILIKLLEEMKGSFFPPLSKINDLFKMCMLSSYVVSLDEYSSMFLKVLV